MPNPVPAAAEGLPEINRRRLLGNLAAITAASATVGATVAVAATHETPVEMSAKDRFEFHLAGLKAAAVELDPRIGSWNTLRFADDDLQCAVCITAHRVTGRYEGDGTYEAGSAKVWGDKGTYVVTLLSEQRDGHRTFSVRNKMDRMVLTEPRLNTFIGRRVS